MATFPPLPPSSRTFTPGEYPHTTYTALSGDQSRVRHTDAVIGARLVLSWVRLTEAERLSIEQHYYGQEGEFLAFALSAEVWSGFNPADFTDGAGLWRYAGPPEFEDFCGPYSDGQVELVSVPGGAPGAALATVAVSFQPGEAINIPPPLSRTVTVSFTPGAASITTPELTLLLLHMEGTGQSFTDSSTFARTVTVQDSGSSSDPTQSTAQAKFGNKSAYFPSGVPSLYVSGLGLGSSSPYTIELFFRIPSSWANGSGDPTEITLWSGGGSYIYYDRTQGLWMACNTQTTQTYIGTLAADTWHYIKWTRAANQTLRRFLNESEVYTTQTYTNISSLNNITIGARTFGESDHSWRGYVDEVRVRTGTDNSLGVPTEAFPNP